MIEAISDEPPLGPLPPLVNEEDFLKQPFVSAILQMKEVFRELLESLSESSSISFSESRSDPLNFGTFLTDVKELESAGLLLPEVQMRRAEIREQKEHWRGYVHQLEMDQLYAEVTELLQCGGLIPLEDGDGGAYLLVDRKEIPRFVVKPVDEEISCLNNRKGYGTPFNDVDHRSRDEIPLYRSAQTDALSWETAVLAGIPETTPKAVMAIIDSDRFYDLSIWSEAGVADTEKLCSVQEFIPDSENLLDLLSRFYKEGLSDEEIAARIDQQEFEEVCLFVWLAYDTDAHGGNFRTFVKRTDESGRKVYGIKKIDNALSFPERNTEYIDILTWMPNALQPLSPRIKEKIEALPVEKILEMIDAYEMSACKRAFCERIEILKILSQREGMTFAEIDLRFLFLSREGKDWAINPLSTQEVVKLLQTKSYSSATEKN